MVIYLLLLFDRNSQCILHSISPAVASMFQNNFNTTFVCVLKNSNNLEMTIYLNSICKPIWPKLSMSLKFLISRLVQPTFKLFAKCSVEQAFLPGHKLLFSLCSAHMTSLLSNSGIVYLHNKTRNSVVPHVSLRDRWRGVITLNRMSLLFTVSWTQALQKGSPWVL